MDPVELAYPELGPRVLLEELREESDGVVSVAGALCA